MPGYFASIRVAPINLETVYISDSEPTPVPGAEPFDIYGTYGDDVISLIGQGPAVGHTGYSVHLGAGNDEGWGSQYGDQIDGEDGNDELWGVSGNDTLIGGAGQDYLNGGDGNDILEGGDDADSLVGAGGDDRLIGGSGDDHLSGGVGNDVLDGGLGQDRLNGYTGADTFVLSDKTTADIIADFRVTDGDKIDVSALLDSATNFSGTTAAQAFNQGYLYVVQLGSPGFGGDLRTALYVDPDGGTHGTGDFAVAVLENVHASTLSSLPFIV